MSSTVLQLLLVVANVLGAGMIVPQVVRLHRTRVAAGVSGVGLGVGMVLNLWWVIYAVQGRLWGIVPVSVASIGLYVTLSLLYVRIVGRRGYQPLAFGSVVIALVPLPFLLFGGWEATGLVIGGSYGLQFSPAVVDAIRSSDVRGIAPMTWSMAWVEASIWLTYGVVVDDPALVVGGAGGAAMASIILGRLVVAGLQPSSLSQEVDELVASLR